MRSKVPVHGSREIVEGPSDSECGPLVSVEGSDASVSEDRHNALLPVYAQGNSKYTRDCGWSAAETVGDVAALGLPVPVQRRRPRGSSKKPKDCLGSRIRTRRPRKTESLTKHNQNVRQRGKPRKNTRIPLQDFLREST